MKNRYLLIILFLLGSITFYAQGAITGQAIDSKTDLGLIYAEILIYKNDVFITGTTTDFDGNYSLTNISSGTYQMKSKYLGYDSEIVQNVQIKKEEIARIDFFLDESTHIFETVIICGYKRTLATECWDYCQGKVTSVDGCCGSCGAQEDQIDDELIFRSMDDTADIIFYPNPTIDVIYINDNDSISDLCIFSISGRRMATPIVTPHQIEMAHLEPGTYFLNYKKDGALKTEKVIKI